MISSNSELKVAIVGAGKMGLEHARVIARTARLGARVVAVVDPQASARTRILTQSPSAQGFSSLEQALVEQETDVLHVCTPAETHEDLAAVGLESRCHVYVEKPFAQSAAAARKIVQLAQRGNLKICAGHQLLFEEPARRLRELSVAIGRLAHVESFFSFRPVRYSADSRRLLRADLQLLDILPHPLYLLLHFLASPSTEHPAELTAVHIGPRATVHALIRRGELAGSLVVSLEARPIESYVRLTGTNGSLQADFVRDMVQELIGPGTSQIDKVLNPIRLSRQLASGAVAAGARRISAIARPSYRGLPAIFEAFYSRIRTNAPSPVSEASIIETTRIWEEIASELELAEAESVPVRKNPTHLRVLVTGGTGFLGREVTRALARRGSCVRAVARRLPAPWDRVAGVEYVAADIADEIPEPCLQNIDLVIHCAAETAGGWDEHNKNSIRATENVVRASAAAGISRLIHVSSLAVLAGETKKTPLAEESPLMAPTRRLGPYVWGKLTSERLAAKLARDLELQVKILRPGAIVDWDNLEPPGRLGRRLGNIFVAVGSPLETLGVVSLTFAAETIAWAAENFERVPTTLHLLEPNQPLKRELVSTLRRSNPGLIVLWLPRALLWPLSWFVATLSGILRRGRPALNLSRIFAKRTYDTSRIERIAREVLPGQ